MQTSFLHRAQVFCIEFDLFYEFEFEFEFSWFASLKKAKETKMPKVSPELNSLISFEFEIVLSSAKRSSSLKIEFDFGVCCPDKNIKWIFFLISNLEHSLEATFSCQKRSVTRAKVTDINISSIFSQHFHYFNIAVFTSC